MPGMVILFVPFIIWFFQLSKKYRSHDVIVIITEQYSALHKKLIQIISLVFWSLLITYIYL